MYECPECGEKFELVIEKKAIKALDDKQVFLTVVHDHEQGLWRAAVKEAGERRSPEGKDIENKHAAAKTTARQKKVAEDRAKKVGLKGKGWAKGPTEEERAEKIRGYNEWSTAQSARAQATKQR